jgi:tRNA(fMet)-specific endonuclease VapC
MSGKRYLLDTNAVVALLRNDGRLHETLSSATWIGISVISILEFRAFPGLSDSDELNFNSFLERIEVVDLGHSDSQLIEAILGFRRCDGLKIPDAIIAGSARISDAILVTADRDFRKANGLQILNEW